MPYGKFVKRGNKVIVHKKSGGKAFASHSPSKAKAHKTAGMREMAEKGTLRVAKRGKRKKKSRRA
jgi:hypothetical protein